MLPGWESLEQQFAGQLVPLAAPSDDQLYARLEGAGIREVTEFLQTRYQARLVSIFGEDRTPAAGVFYIYYVFEAKHTRAYLILQAPISPDQSRFPSLAAGLPAVNWQEREIQDWFGLEAAGHPNPRQMSLSRSRAHPA